MEKRRLANVCASVLNVYPKIEVVVSYADLCAEYLLITTHKLLRAALLVFPGTTFNIIGWLNPNIMAETTKTTVTEETHNSGSDERTEVSRTTEIKSNDVHETPRHKTTETTTTTTTVEND